MVRRAPGVPGLRRFPCRSALTLSGCRDGSRSLQSGAQIEQSCGMLEAPSRTANGRGSMAVLKACSRPANSSFTARLPSAALITGASPSRGSRTSVGLRSWAEAAGAALNAPTSGDSSVAVASSWLSAVIWLERSAKAAVSLASAWSFLARASSLVTGDCSSAWCPSPPVISQLDYSPRHGGHRPADSSKCQRAGNAHQVRAKCLSPPPRARAWQSCRRGASWARLAARATTHRAPS